MTFDNYKFRCSALGKIMSESGKITQGNETYLRELFIGEMYSIRKEVTSRYFEKGKFTEEDGITLLGDTVHQGRLVIKNKERKENNFIHGEADCVIDDLIYDIKNAWDLFSFGKASLTYEYEWQLRGYMWLWEKPTARLFYCLNNMPEHMLCAEERKLFYANNFVSLDDENYIALCEELRKKHNYDKMPLYERFRMWEIGHDELKIEALENKIHLCRKKLNEWLDEWNATIEKNKALIFSNREEVKEV